MLAIVVLTVVAAVQVECAPSQFWPGFSNAPSFTSQPNKKPIFSTQIHKGFPSKTRVPDHAETQRAYEDFIQIWLDQARLTLNTANAARFSPRPNVGEPVVVAEAITENPRIQEVVPVESDQTFFMDPEPTSHVDAEPTSYVDPESTYNVDSEPTSYVDPEPTSYVDPEPASFVEAEPTSFVEAEPTFFVEAEPTSFIEAELTSLIEAEPTSFVEAEPTSFVEAEPTSFVEAEPTSFVEAEIQPMEQPDKHEPVFIDVQPTPEILTSVAVETEVVPDDIALVAEENIPTLVEQDTSTVLRDEIAQDTIAVLPSVEPMAEPSVEQSFVEAITEAPAVKSTVEQAVKPTEEIVVEPIIEPFVENAAEEPVEEFQPQVEPTKTIIPAGRSISSTSSRHSAMTLEHRPTIIKEEFPGATFHPSVLVHPQPARLPARAAGAINTEGLTYTLQFFPTQGRSHYFVSTPIGGSRRF
ncbi:proteoglycan 4 [Procambarus clarkii]|uniref:proteoglycan 4 n=1 Tax=Procambarus clarkii TaxID=6728 RepID=UPI001E670924|nr:proteoglycan 4-like [Procambarus clarkii]